MPMPVSETREGKAEPRSAEALRGRPFGLAELLEQHGLLLRGLGPSIFRVGRYIGDMYQSGRGQARGTQAEQW